MSRGQCEARVVTSAHSYALLVFALLVMFARNAAAESSDVSMTRAKSCFESAQRAYARDLLPEARDGFLCAYQLAPSAELAWNLARVYERMGEVDDGIRYYELYLASGPKDDRERKDVERRVLALRALHDRQSTDIKAALPTQGELSDEARTFFQRGVKLYRRGKFDAALVAFGAALRVSGATELRYNLAVTSERLNKLSDALDHYRAYLAARPDAEDAKDIKARIEMLRAKLP